MFLTQLPGLAKQRNLLLLEKSSSTIFCHTLPPSNLLLLKHMSYLMILLMIFLTFLLAMLLHTLTHSSLLLSKHMAYLMILLLMIFLTFFVAKSLLVLVILAITRFSIKWSLLPCTASTLDLSSFTTLSVCQTSWTIIGLYRISVNNFLMCATLGNLVKRI